MKSILSVILVVIMASTPTMASAGAGKTILIASGVGFCVLGIVTLVAGEKDYAQNKADYRVSTSEADRVHKNYQSIAYSLFGLGALGIAVGIWLPENQPSTNVSIYRVDNTDVLVLSRAF